MAVSHAVAGSFTATSQSSSFAPYMGGRSTMPGQFNVWLKPTAFIGTVQMERSPPGSSDWYTIGVWSEGAYTQLSEYTLAGTEGNSSEILSESENGTLYRLNCTAYTSGTLAYIIGGAR